MRRVFGMVCLGVVSCANPSVDGVPEDPGNRPPPLPETPGVHPAPTAGEGSTDDGPEPSNPNASADAGAVDRTEDSTDVGMPPAPATSNTSSEPTDVAGNSTGSETAEPVHSDGGGLTSEESDAGGDAGGVTSDTSDDPSETDAANDGGLGDTDVR